MKKPDGILLETGTNEMELLVIIIDGQLFGINVAKVVSIQKHDEELVTKIPQSDSNIIGMLLYRKNTIPFINLANILGKKQSENDENDIVVVTEFNNTINSFKVHGVDRIHRISWTKLTPLNSMISNSSLIIGSVCIDSKDILVLDLEHILATLFPRLTLEKLTDDTVQETKIIKRDKIKILFAEDSDLIRRGVVNALTTSGIKNIHSFSDGQIAYNYIKKNKDEIAKDIEHTIVITDIEMPEMDGLSLCKKIKTDSVLSDIHVIMFSSLINVQMIEKCKSIGADNYITKPEINKLIHILDQYCDS